MVAQKTTRKTGNELKLSTIIFENANEVDSFNRFHEIWNFLITRFQQTEHETEIGCHEHENMC